MFEVCGVGIILTFSIGDHLSVPVRQQVRTNKILRSVKSSYNESPVLPKSGVEFCHSNSKVRVEDVEVVRDAPHHDQVRLVPAQPPRHRP